MCKTLCCTIYSPETMKEHVIHSNTTFLQVLSIATAFTLLSSAPSYPLLHFPSKNRTTTDAETARTWLTDEYSIRRNVFYYTSAR